MIVFTNCHVTKVNEKFYMEDIGDYEEVPDGTTFDDVSIFTHNGFATVIGNRGIGKKYRSSCFKALYNGLNKYLQC